MKTHQCLIAIVVAGLFAASGCGRTANVPASETPSWLAVGTHKCQSSSSLGHTCEVRNYFDDCNEAFLSLKGNDCCGKTANGGTSIEFNLDSCMPQ